MLKLLLVALLASGVFAEDAVAEPAKTAEKAVPIESAATVSKDADSAEQRMRMPMGSMDPDHDQEDRDDHLYLKAKLDGHRPEGPLVARTLHSSIGHGPNIAAQDEIIRFTYSPAYYQPMWVLDYRFLKSGGRRYTRGPGGQILILPRSYKHSKGDGTHDYDSMIEHLRLKLIAEQNQSMREHGFAHQHDRGHNYEQDHLGEQGPMQHEHEPIHHREHGPIHREHGPIVREHVPINHEHEPIHHLQREREREPILHREREPILHREREPILHREHGPNIHHLQRERERIAQRELEPILHHEREPIHHRQHEPVLYGHMEPVRMEREQRERMMNMGRENLLYH